MFDVPAEGGLVLEVLGLAVGAEEVADRAGLLVGDDGLLLDLHRVDGCHGSLHLLAVEVGEDDLLVAVMAGHERFHELVGEDVVAEGGLVVVDGLVPDVIVFDEVLGGGVEYEAVLVGPVGAEAFVDAGDDLGKELFIGISEASGAGVDRDDLAFVAGERD